MICPVSVWSLMREDRAAFSIAPQQTAMCEHRAQMHWSAARGSPTLKAFPYEKESRKLQFSSCLPDQSQGAGVVSR